MRENANPRPAEILQGSAPACGRPVKYLLPDAAPDTPEGVAKTVFPGRPRKDRRYLQDRPSARRK